MNDIIRARMQIKPNYKVRNIAGEYVIVEVGELNASKTKVIVLNETSLWLWNEFQGVAFDVRGVAAAISREYGVDAERSMADAQRWVEGLQRAGLLE